MRNLTSLARRVNKLMGAMPSEEERIIGHLPEWERARLATHDLLLDLAAKIEVFDNPDLSEEEQASMCAAIEIEIEQRERSPEEVAARSWLARKYGDQMAGAKDELLRILASNEEITQ